MSVFMPTSRAEKITDINLCNLKKLSIRVILLDVDNTVVSYRDKSPLNGVSEWISEAKEAGFEVFIVSNNRRKERVKLIADEFQIPYEYLALKPLPKGFLRAFKRVGCKKSECVVIGDQIFTDVLGANLAKMKSVLLDPIEEETGFLFKIKRKLERKMRKKYFEKVSDISEK